MHDHEMWTLYIHSMAVDRLIHTCQQTTKIYHSQAPLAPLHPCSLALIHDCYHNTYARTILCIDAGGGARYDVLLYQISRCVLLLVRRRVNGNTEFRKPRALSCSVPSAARTLLRARGFLNSVFPLDEPRLTYLDHRAALGTWSALAYAKLASFDGRTLTTLS